MKYLLHTLYTVFVLAIFAMALLFVGTKVPLFGYEVKVVQSGSMEPSVPLKSLVIVAPQPKYEIGDVITFGADTRFAVPVTHRIVATRGTEAAPVFVTKGDANEEADPIPVPRDEVIGSVALTIPFLGYLIEFVRTPLGYGLLVGLPALVIILDAFADVVWEVRKGIAKRRQGKVGYRVPSRQRQPRGRSKMRRPRPSPAEHKHHRPTAAPQFELDLRNYQPTQRGA